MKISHITHCSASRTSRMMKLSPSLKAKMSDGSRDHETKRVVSRDMSKMMDGSVIFRVAVKLAASR